MNSLNDATAQAADLWRANGGTATVLFDMGAGLPVRNVIGVGDPDVHCIDGRWRMFLGGFTTGFAVRIFEARLPEGHELDSDDWRLVPTRPGGRRAATLFRPPRWGAWDSHGTHTPSFVQGRDRSGQPVRRIYYAGRATARNGGPHSRYAIGVAELRGGRWVRRPTPVLSGAAPRRSVFEPLVRFADGVWHLWFQAAPHEVGPGEQPDYELRYTRSADGLTDWADPVTVFTSEDAFFDNSVRQSGDHAEMVLARGSNPYGTTPYPAQGLWWARASRADGGREAWSPDPLLLLDAESDPPDWLSRGAFGPDFQYGRQVHDADTMYLFTSGTSPAAPWRTAALDRLRRRRLPPVPAPFTLNVGRLTIPHARQSLAAASTDVVDGRRGGDG